MKLSKGSVAVGLAGGCREVNSNPALPSLLFIVFKCFPVLQKTLALEMRSGWLDKAGAGLGRSGVVGSRAVCFGSRSRGPACTSVSSTECQASETPRAAEGSSAGVNSM